MDNWTYCKTSGGGTQNKKYPSATSSTYRKQNICKNFGVHCKQKLAIFMLERCAYQEQKCKPIKNLLDVKF